MTKEKGSGPDAPPAPGGLNEIREVAGVKSNATEIEGATGPRGRAIVPGEAGRVVPDPDQAGRDVADGEAADDDADEQRGDVSIAKVHGKHAHMIYVGDEIVGRIARKTGDGWIVKLDADKDFKATSATACKAYVFGFFDGIKHEQG